MQWLLLPDCQLFNMPLNTADVSLDATFDNIKSSLDTIVPMGQDLLCLKRETDKLVPIEPEDIQNVTRKPKSKHDS